MKLHYSSILLPLLLTSTSVHAFAPRQVLTPTRSLETTLRYKDDTDPVKVDVDSKAKRKLDMESLLKTRPYPLFLMEKAAAMVDHATEGLFKQREDDSEQERTVTKEKVVVLGSGWGAANFLTEIDPEKYDITVVSNRNHFIFTPMLAGASVGSVDFRSITEPIREVCIRVARRGNTLCHQ